MILSWSFSKDYLWHFAAANFFAFCFLAMCFIMIMLAAISFGFWQSRLITLFLQGAIDEAWIVIMHHRDFDQVRVVLVAWWLSGGWR